MPPTRLLFLALVTLTPIIAGCAAAVVGGVVVVASTVQDRRSSSTVLEDQSIEIKLRDRLHQDGGPGRGNHIKTISHNHVVLLVGEVRESGDKQRAGQIAEEMPQVRRVVNELEVTTPVGLGRRSRDSLLTTQVKSSLFGLDIDGFNPTHVNVVSVHGSVYLMGMLTEEEAEAVVERARRQRGVQRVVKVFEFLEPKAEAQPQAGSDQ